MLMKLRMPSPVNFVVDDVQLKGHFKDFRWGCSCDFVYGQRHWHYASDWATGLECKSQTLSLSHSIGACVRGGLLNLGVGRDLRSYSKEIDVIFNWVGLSPFLAGFLCWCVLRLAMVSLRGSGDSVVKCPRRGPDRAFFVVECGSVSSSAPS